MPVVTAFYAALLALLCVLLSNLVIRQRRQKRVGLGDGGDAALTQAIRAFGNFVEYTPLFVVLMALAEMLGTQRPWLHAYGALFVAGRVAHAIGLSRTGRASAGRLGGMVVTQFVLIALAVSLLVATLPQLAR